MTQPMTLTTARELLADCLAQDCLGEGDAAALRLVLETLDARTRALSNLLGPAAAVLDDYSSLVEAGILEGDEDREDTANALCDDLALHIGKADAALES